MCGDGCAWPKSKPVDPQWEMVSCVRVWNASKKEDQSAAVQLRLLEESSGFKNTKRAKLAGAGAAEICCVLQHA